MAKGTLLTNFVDDILNATMNGKRRYKLIPNDDGTYSLEDVTTYDQIGTDFGAAVVNAIANAVNESADKNKIIDDIDTINGLTEEGYIAGGLALKNVTNSLTALQNSFANKYANESIAKNTTYGIRCNGGYGSFIAIGFMEQVGGFQIIIMVNAGNVLMEPIITTQQNTFVLERMTATYSDNSLYITPSENTNLIMLGTDA